MSIYQSIVNLQARGEQAALCVIVSCSGSTPRRAGSKMLVHPDGRIEGTIGGGEMESRVIETALAVIESGQPQLLSYSFTDPSRGDPGVCGGQMEVYVEPITPQPNVIVFGAGHVGLAIADLAAWLGYYVILADDREGFATPENAPRANEFHQLGPTQLADTLPIHTQSNIIFTTRSVDLDVPALPALLQTPARYIGVIGSRRRWQTAHAQLLDAGVPEELLDRVVSPIGLEINAETPQEIAVSVMAEIIMLVRGGDGERMGV